MNEFNTYEFVVAQKSEGGVKARRILGVIGLVLGFLIIAGLTCLTPLVPMVAVEFTLYLPFSIFVWRRMHVEYEYSMTSGMITFTNIYGGKSKKVQFEACIKDMREIAPYTDEARAHLETLGLKKDFVMVSAMDAPDMYYAVFELNSEPCVVYFEATQKALQIFHFYNPSTVVTTVTR